MEQILLEKIKKLGIKEFENFNSLNLMDGNYLNIECTLPNGLMGIKLKFLITIHDTMQNRLILKEAINVMV